MNSEQASKEAFKLGFVLKMAEEGIGASDLVDASTVLTQKVVKKAAKGLPGPGINPLSGLTTLGALGFGAGIAAPSLLGGLGGTAAGAMSSEEYDTVEQAKKRHLIHKYRTMIKQLKNQQDNRLISDVLSGKASDEEPVDD